MSSSAAPRSSKPASGRAPADARAAAAPVPGVDRKGAILLAAEKLFAQRGFHAVTIRQIATEAGVPLALVGYYFGQKHELFHAIFEHWRGTIDARLALLQQAQATDRDAGLMRRIVQAFVEPVLQMRASPEGEYYALLVARELAYRTPDADRVLVDYFDPMAHAFIDALQSARPTSLRPQVAWAYQFAMGALLHHLIDHRVERLSRGLNHANDPAAGILLVDFMTAGIDALLPASPSRSRSTKTNP